MTFIKQSPLFDKGELKSIIHAVFDLEETETVDEFIEENKNISKVVMNGSDSKCNIYQIYD